MTTTPEQRITILKHLANGKGLNVVATITRLTTEQVTDVAKHHGYPDREKLAWAADILEKKRDDTDLASIPTSTAPTPIRPATPPRPPARPTPPPSTAPNPAHAAAVDQIQTLLDNAQDATSKRIQTLATKITADVGKLRTLIDTERAKAAEREKKAAEKEAARAEVARLQRELADAKAALTKTSGADSGSRPAGARSETARIRDWARGQGMDLPDRGRLPANVRDAYAAAHPDQAAAS